MTIADAELQKLRNNRLLKDRTPRLSADCSRICSSRKQVELPASLGDAPVTVAVTREGRSVLQ